MCPILPFLPNLSSLSWDSNESLQCMWHISPLWDWAHPQRKWHRHRGLCSKAELLKRLWFSQETANHRGALHTGHQVACADGEIQAAAMENPEQQNRVGKREAESSGTQCSMLSLLTQKQLSAVETGQTASKSVSRLWRLPKQPGNCKTRNSTKHFHVCQSCRIYPQMSRFALWRIWACVLQVERQLHLAADAVVALKDKVYKLETMHEKQLHAQHASEILAAQIPRLELYASMHVRLFVTRSVAAALQFM